MSSLPPLGESDRDVVARTVTTLAGAIPVLGQVFQVILNEIIPNARLQRVETYLLRLQQRIDETELRKASTDREKLDIFEEGLWQSTRALGDDRREYIAELVAKGITEDNARAEAKHFLRILNQLDDTQIIILCSYQRRYRVIANPEAAKFYKRHRQVLGPFSREISAQNPDRGKAAHKDALERHLASFGLLEPETSELRVGRVAYAMTPQGLQFLRFLGILED